MHTYRITIKLRVKPTIKTKRVAILGAGPGGIVSAKYAVENGFTPVVFDKKAIPGGLWSSGTAIWEGMHTNVSRYSVMFSDFPWPDKSSLIPSAKEVYNYLLSYIKHYQLENYFQFNSNVDQVKYLPNKKWQLTWTNYLTGEQTTEVFDYLMCSTGLHCMPNWPEFKNIESYKGILMHSVDYKTLDPRLKDKKVIVVGNSYSGVEISAHLVGHAKTIVNIFNRPYLSFPRLLKVETNEKNVYNIIPVDLFYGRELCFSIPINKEEERKSKIELFGKLCPHQTNKAKCHPAMYYELDDDEPIREAVTDNYYPYIMRGKIKPKKARITYFAEDGVRLSDGSFEKADVVLFCTGYKICLNYFEQSVLDTLKFDPNRERLPIMLYKYTVHPDLENMAMIGVCSGLFFAGFELQARWAFKLFKGEKILPPRYVIDEEMGRDELLRESLENNQYPHGLYNEIIEKLAFEADALPDFKKIAKTDPKLFEMLWKNGTIPSHFCYDTHKELSIKIMKEVDEIINKKYTLTKEEAENATSSIVASKFSKYFKIPLYLFKE
jgi:dimethylaniline monooxygenase (N-oxide forming)